MDLFTIASVDKMKEINEVLTERKATSENPLHATFSVEKDQEAKKIKANKGDAKDYSGTLIIEEVQSEQEFNIFVFIFLLTLVFGVLIIIFLKKLKKLTHGAEDHEGENFDGTEGIELAEEV